MDLEIVSADSGDPGHVADLFALLKEFSEHPASGPTPLSFDDPGTIGAALARTPHAFALLAYVGGEPAGYAFCFELLSTFSARPYVYVHDLMTAAGHRRKGVAAALLARVEEIARGLGAVRVDLEVVAGNEAAKCLYARCGFEAASPNEALGIEEHWHKILG